jgi:uncharacterized protein (DUF1778 family)
LKQIHVRLSESLHRELRIQAAIIEQTLQDYVVDAVRDKIALDKAKLMLAKETTNDVETK